MTDDESALGDLSLAAFAMGGGLAIGAIAVAISVIGLPDLAPPTGPPLPEDFSVRLADGSTRDRSWFEGRAWVVNLWSPS